MSSILDRVTRLWPRTGPLSTLTGQRLALGVVTVLLAAVPIVLDAPPAGLRAGDPAPRTFRAGRLVRFVDEDATRALRSSAAASVEAVYRYDPTIAADARERVSLVFAGADAARRAFPEDVERRVAAMRDEGVEVDTGALLTAVTLPEGDLQALERASAGIVDSAMRARVKPEDLESVRQSVSRTADVLPLPLAQRHLVGAAAGWAVEPTLRLDTTATGAARDAAVAAVRPVVVVRQAGEVVIQRDDVVTPSQIEILRRLGALENRAFPGSLLATVLLIGLTVFGAAIYLSRYEPDVWARFRKLLALATLFVGMVWVGRGVVWLLPEWSPYLMPVPMAAMLAALLVGPRTGVLAAVFVAITSLLMGFSSAFHLVAVLIASLVSIVAVASISERRHLFLAGLSVSATYGAVSFVSSLAGGGSLQSSAAAGGFGLLGGVLAAVLTFGLLPFFEVAFGVTTDVRLLELANPAHPLLKRLMVAAPGTYSHSVMAGNLAETAAEAVGANPLLARVGAYYHDIGKIRRPQFFVENQGGCENPHDNTSPGLSALIIHAHVKEGVELAVEHRLPEEIVDIIRQHHGDSLVTYFYDKAQRGEAGCVAAVVEADFRYEGERPASKEAALVMLADSVEAAVRCIGTPSLPRVEDAVRKVVNAKVADHQLDSAGLTLSDIETVVQTYAKMLVNVYHPRIEYPTRDAGSASDAGTCIQPSST